jgi:hypothetical protein
MQSKAEDLRLFTKALATVSRNAFALAVLDRLSSQARSITPALDYLLLPISSWNTFSLESSEIG